MALLTSLKLVAAQRSNKIPPAVQRRNKLIKALNEQIAAAQAQAEGRTYAPTKQKKALDTETGQRVTITVPKRVKSWYWINEAGKVQLSIRYGAKILDLAKGKNAIEIEFAQLVATLETVKHAVEAGELDAAIEAASMATKHNFEQ